MTQPHFSVKKIIDKSRFPRLPFARPVRVQKTDRIL